MLIIPRVARMDISGVMRHVIVRGIEEKTILLDDGDRQRFLDRLSLIIIDPETLCYAWPLMRSHVHPLLNLVRFKLAVPMKRLLTDYAVTFNLVHRQRGIFCYAAVRELGYKGVEIGKELNLGSAGRSGEERLPFAKIQS